MGILVDPLNNWLRHHSDRGLRDEVIDPYSSACTFEGWTELGPHRRWRPAEGFDPIPVADPHSWLATVGWLRAGGRISVHTVPSGR